MPIVEPEVLMDGAHTIERCEEVTGDVLHAVFDELFDQTGAARRHAAQAEHGHRGQRTCATQASIEEVARPRCAACAGTGPAAVPGIVFFPGVRITWSRTAHLNAINQLDGPKPWKLGFSYGRALQDEALHAWHGKPENLQAGQRVFYHRAKCVSAAALGTYTKAMEGELARA